jgi:hypothetical protein
MSLHKHEGYCTKRVVAIVPIIFSNAARNYLAGYASVHAAGPSIPSEIIRRAKPYCLLYALFIHSFNDAGRAGPEWHLLHCCRASFTPPGGGRQCLLQLVEHITLRADLENSQWNTILICRIILKACFSWPAYTQQLGHRLASIF